MATRSLEVASWAREAKQEAFEKVEEAKASVDAEPSAPEMPEEASSEAP